jgi:hypothetical protein
MSPSLAGTKQSALYPVSSLRGTKQSALYPVSSPRGTKQSQINFNCCAALCLTIPENNHRMSYISVQQRSFDKLITVTYLRKSLQSASSGCYHPKKNHHFQKKIPNYFFYSNIIHIFAASYLAKNKGSQCRLGAPILYTTAYPNRTSLVY